MTRETERPAVAAPGTKPTWIDRIPPWARIGVPAVVLTAGTAIVWSVVAAAAPRPATAESLCRSAAEDRLEARGRSDIDASRTFEVTSAGGAQRLSGTVTFVDDSGTARIAAVRCVIRADGDSMQIRSVRFSE